MPLCFALGGRESLRPPRSWPSVDSVRDDRATEDGMSRWSGKERKVAVDEER